jgi:hypothetical protein
MIILYTLHPLYHTLDPRGLRIEGKKFFREVVPEGFNLRGFIRVQKIYAQKYPKLSIMVGTSQNSAQNYPKLSIMTGTSQNSAQNYPKISIMLGSSQNSAQNYPKISVMLGTSQNSAQNYPKLSTMLGTSQNSYTRQPETRNSDCKGNGHYPS